MYTRCPQCGTVYRIEVRQLRQGRGEAICQRCGIIFGALETLAETAADALTDQDDCLLELPTLGSEAAVAVAQTAPAPPRNEPPPTEEPVTKIDTANDVSAPLPARRRWPWRVAAVVLTLSLAGQILFFEKARIANDPDLRPLLEWVCRWFGCRLPPFRNLDAIEAVDRALYPAKDARDAYDFYLVLVNQAPYPQPYPLLKLTLTALDGTPIATRIFKPEEYLKTANPPLMPPRRMIFIELQLAAPRRPVGGFQFELLS